MPYAFIIVGIILLTAGVRGQSGRLVTLLQGDLKGENNFAYWILAILAIGAIGYVDDFRAFSRALLTLIIIVLLLAGEKHAGGAGGFFTKIQEDMAAITKSGATA